MTIYKHQVVFLPEHTPSMIAELDALSIDGWEFVAWLTGPLRSEPPSRMALLRRPEPEQNDKV
jgi:hypothetical protein